VNCTTVGAGADIWLPRQTAHRWH